MTERGPTPPSPLEGAVRFLGFLFGVLWIVGGLALVVSSLHNSVPWTVVGLALYCGSVAHRRRRP